MIKPKPLWLRAITPRGTWVTIYPHIYYPESVIDPNLEIYKDVIVHEQTHLRQQKKMGLEEWMIRYLRDSEFRVDQECEATAHQIMSVPYQYRTLKMMMSQMLGGSIYMNASKDRVGIEEKIDNYLKQLGFVEPPAESIPWWDDLTWISYKPVFDSDRISYTPANLDSDRRRL